MILRRWYQVVLASLAASPRVSNPEGPRQKPALDQLPTVEAVHVEKEALRVSEQEDEDVIRENPLLAYLPPDRYATIDETNAFPFPAGFQK